MADHRIAELHTRRARLYEGGGPRSIAKQHERRKLTARERLALLYDVDSFQESHLFVRHRCTHFNLAGKEMPGEGVVVGVGSVAGRRVFSASQDFTVAGGSVGEATAFKICAAMDNALKMGCPFVFINDSGGARIQEGVDSLAGYGSVFHRNVLLSGVVPQISIIAGPCAGGAAYSPALTDFVIHVQGTGQMYITGPRVIEQVTGEKVTAEDLGGARSCASRSGVAHFVAESDAHGVQIAKELLSYLPQNNIEDPPIVAPETELTVATDEALNAVVPSDPQMSYNIRDVLSRVLDPGTFLEVHALFAPNIVVGFGRVLGRSVGVIANQPYVKAGVLDIDASDKSSRFIRFCNAFNIPLLTFVDVPGFLPGVQQEYNGIIRHGAKMLFAYGASTVPKVTVIVRKAYGGAYLAMCSKDMGADIVCAWPSAEIAVMGAEGAVNVLYRSELAAAQDPDAERTRRVAEYRETFATPYVAASRGQIDDIIEPSETRAYVAMQLDVLRSKRELRPQKKHGLIPL